MPRVWPGFHQIVGNSDEGSAVWFAVAVIGAPPPSLPAAGVDDVAEVPAADGRSSGRPWLARTHAPDFWASSVRVVPCGAGPRTTPPGSPPFCHNQIWRSRRSTERCREAATFFSLVARDSLQASLPPGAGSDAASVYPLASARLPACWSMTFLSRRGDSPSGSPSGAAGTNATCGRWCGRLGVGWTKTMVVGLLSAQSTGIRGPQGSGRRRAGDGLVVVEASYRSGCKQVPLAALSLARHDPLPPRSPRQSGRRRPPSPGRNVW